MSRGAVDGRFLDWLVVFGVMIAEGLFLELFPETVVFVGQFVLPNNEIADCNGQDG